MRTCDVRVCVCVGMHTHRRGIHEHTHYVYRNLEISVLKNFCGWPSHENLSHEIILTRIIS